MSDLLKIIIIGAGGFGKEALSLVNDCNKVKKEFNVIGFVDDNIELQKKIINDLPVLGNTEWLISSNDSSIGCEDGTVVQAGVKISCNIKLGKFTYVNFNSVVGHDCILNDFVTLSPNCTVNGENIVQEGVFFGSGAVTRDKIKIGKWCHIGACSVIVKNIPDNSLFFAASGTSKNF